MAIKIIYAEIYAQTDKKGQKNVHSPLFQFFSLVHCWTSLIEITNFCHQDFFLFWTSGNFLGPGGGGAVAEWSKALSFKMENK